MRKSRCANTFLEISPRLDPPVRTRALSLSQTAVPAPISLEKVDAWLLGIITREHSVRMRREVVDWVGHSARRFAQLVALVLHGSRQQAQRASYPMTFAVEAVPALGGPHVPELLRNLQRADLHGGVIRNTMRLLRFVKLNAANEGAIFATAFAALNAPVEIAVKADAISVLARLVRRFPELYPEVEAAIREALPGTTTAFRSRARTEFKIMSGE